LIDVVLTDVVPADPGLAVVLGSALQYSQIKNKRKVLRAKGRRSG
jgi:hypothetical protein